MNSTAPIVATKSTLTELQIRQLREVPILASLNDDRLSCLDGTTSLHLAADQVLIRQGDLVKTFCILLEGRLQISTNLATGSEQLIYVGEKGFAFGEVPLLANIPSTATIRALEPCDLLQLDEEQFWRLMTECPEVRKAILGNMAMRLAKIQTTTFQQEKMAALGTLAAGLMHELNNPGSAARRASSQLRTNLIRLHELAARFTRITLSEGQKECILELQEHALQTPSNVSLSAMEQTDAEETLAEWLESAGVDDSWRLAPTLVSVGINSDTLGCTRSMFDGEVFSDALNWLEALVSSQQMVGTIEESISRITELVGAVKTYAYEGKGIKQSIELNKSIKATVIILAHKIREKQITLVKDLGADLPALAGECGGINQVWTNLLDNAIDAAPQGGKITLKTWMEAVATDGGKRRDLCISIEDNGVTGIPLECQAQIFDPFFTTKPVGVGTGLGLGIVYRIVEQCGGSIRFSSIPGSTEFVVRLPAA